MFARVQDQTHCTTNLNNVRYIRTYYYYYYYVSKMGMTELIFVDPGMKVVASITAMSYSQHMLPAIKHVAGDTFVLQQDSAPSHRAKDTIKLLQQETPDVVGPDLWPSSSPDLNPVDYEVWSVMQHRMYKMSYEQWR